MSLYIWWMIAFLAFLAFEIITPGTFFFLCFSVGALFAAIAVLVGNSLFTSIIIFCIFSLLSIFLIRPSVIKYFKSKKLEKTNVDAIVGSTGLVVEQISPSNAGKIKISGEIWLAVSNETVETGSTVKINSIDGTKLIVEKIKGE
ncbi:NfeD family protein [Candidatus Ruminimicrobium bovinum]|uniref:NfeD family protein n=1 Tax=Candidatus Ruminimicrobium bovinum TaxID=3242779 RepID=UPI0039B8B2FE